MDSRRTGTWVYDKDLKKCVKVSERIPGLGRFCVEGSRPFCARNGETLDFGSGPTEVRDATEKRALMRKHGVMEAPGRDRMANKPAPAKHETFKEYFYKTHGTDLS